MKVIRWKDLNLLWQNKQRINQVKAIPNLTIAYDEKE